MQFVIDLGKREKAEFHWNVEDSYAWLFVTITMKKSENGKLKSIDIIN